MRYLSNILALIILGALYSPIFLLQADNPALFGMPKLLLVSVIACPVLIGLLTLSALPYIRNGEDK